MRKSPGRDKEFKEETPFHQYDVVLHKKFGPGIVMDVDDKRVSVQFYSKPGTITFRISNCGLLKAFQ
jgi:hypothetical protein